MVKLCRPTNAAIAHIGAFLRPVDAEEVWLSHKYRPEEAVAASVETSPAFCFVAADSDGPFAVFGVSSPSLLAATGSPWLLATPRIDGHRKQLAILSRPIVAQMRRRWLLLENWVSDANMVSIRWLKSCGFTVEEPLAWGACGAPFRRFWARGV